MTPKLELAAITDEFSPDLGEALEAMAPIGMTACELRVVWGKNIMNLTDNEVKKAMEMLNAKGIRVFLHYQQLTEGLVDTLYKIAHKHKGKRVFQIYLYDDNDQPLTFSSGKVGVKISNALFQELQSVAGIGVKLL